MKTKTSIQVILMLLIGFMLAAVPTLASRGTRRRRLIPGRCFRKSGRRGRGICRGSREASICAEDVHG